MAPVFASVNGDFINAFLLVELPFESGSFVDLRGIERRRRACDHGAKDLRQNEKFFHLEFIIGSEAPSAPEPRCFDQYFSPFSFSLLS